MTDDQINIAIAEACGYSPGEANVGYHHEKVSGWWIGGKFTTTIPNYCHDLNAMHEAEQYLSGEIWAKYFDMIQKTGNATGVRATARQRCEAFLRTLGKWREE